MDVGLRLNFVGFRLALWKMTKLTELTELAEAMDRIHVSFPNHAIVAT